MTENELSDSGVITRKLANGAVTNRKLARGALSGSRFRLDSLTGVQVDEDSLGMVPLAADAERAKLATRAETADRVERATLADRAALADLATVADSIATVKSRFAGVLVAEGSTAELAIDCPDGHLAVGGGYLQLNDDADHVQLSSSAPLLSGPLLTPHAWAVVVVDGAAVDTGTDALGAGYALCIKAESD